MATEEYQLGYEAGYQDGWNAAQQPQRRPSYKEWTTDYVRDNLHKLKQPQAEAPVIAQNKAAPVASWDDSRTQKVYEVLTNDNYPPKGSADHWEGWKARLVVDALFPAQPQAEPYTYASKQATACADCGEHKHTPLRIDAMGGYVCLTCIDKKLGSLLGEFGYPEPQAEAVLVVKDGEICYKSKSDDQSYGMWCPVTPDADHGLSNGTELYAAPQQSEAVPNALQKAEARLLNLIGEYWALAYAEGEEGRNYDTPDGAAQRTHAAIAKAVKNLIVVASSAPQQAEAVPPEWVQISEWKWDNEQGHWLGKLIAAQGAKT